MKGWTETYKIEWTHLYSFPLDLWSHFTPLSPMLSPFESLFCLSLHYVHYFLIPRTKPTYSLSHNLNVLLSLKVSRWHAQREGRGKPGASVALR